MKNRHHPPLLRTTLAAATLAAGWLVLAPAAPAPAQTAGSDPAVQVAIQMYRNRARLQEVDRAVADSQGRLYLAQTALAETQRKIDANEAAVKQLKSELQGRAAQVYMKRGGDLGTVLDVEHVVDLSVGERYTNAAAGDGNRRLEQLKALEAQLDQERAERDATRQSIADETTKLSALQSDLETVTAREAALLQQFGAVPIMGDAKLNAAQLAGWFHSTGARAHLAGNTTIEELAQMYIDEGAAEHVAGDVAFAQSIIETGSFSQTNGNNYSGIGNCDSCGGHGMVFPTPRDGVRAQIQLLRNYADPTSRAANLANPPEAPLYGANPQAAATAYDSFFAKGSAPVWNVMGNGNWATDPDYAGKVLGTYGAMLGYGHLHPNG